MIYNAHTQDQVKEILTKTFHLPKVEQNVLI